MVGEVRRTADAPALLDLAARGYVEEEFFISGTACRYAGVGLGNATIANCGLPYYIGGLIPRESKLVLADAALFKAQLNVEVRTLCEAVSIDPQAKKVQLRDVSTGEVTSESYDKLVLSPGAAPIWPALPGIDLPGIFKVRTVPDVHVIREWMEGHVADPSGLDTYTGTQTVLPARRAVVVGGGFIGLEMAENLVHLGLDVTLVQRGPQRGGQDQVQQEDDHQQADKDDTSIDRIKLERLLAG